MRRLSQFILCLCAGSAVAMAAPQVDVSGTVSGILGTPIAGAKISVLGSGIVVTTDAEGRFKLTDVPEDAVLRVERDGYQPMAASLAENPKADFILKDNKAANDAQAYYEEADDIYFDENAIDDEEGTSQNVGALTGASDDIYYNASNYDWNLMRFRFRGYNSEYADTYINGIRFNDIARGRFNYSTLGGMNRAFRNKSISVGLSSSSYGFGDIGGATNISTITDEYAPGFYGSLAYTNSNYMFRAMALYSTGINRHGYGLTVGAVTRQAEEGVIKGTFYHSYAYFLSAEKRFNDTHRLVLTAFGAPTERATPQMTYLEAYDLAGSNLYNPGWGWQNGKKRSSRITRTFDPTFLLNWLATPSHSTTVNTGVALRWVNYSTTALNWYQAADPRPDYYKNLPSYYADDELAYQNVLDYWKVEANRQIDWDSFYQANYLNNRDNATLGTDKGSSYILERRHSNQLNLLFNSTVNHRFNSAFSLQGGASVNYTRAHYYKTIDDLLGGEFWLDIDNFSERDFPDDPIILQNNLNDPNRHVTKGDIFGYDYYINGIQAQAWLQNVITLPKWDVNYALRYGFTQFQRDGKMRNGRAPENSYGKGQTHRFDTGGLKVGAVYKLNGHNFFSLHGGYETRAPLFDYAYVSPRIKDTAISNLRPERVASGDINYNWNYRRFRGQITGFWTEMFDQSERYSFYDDYYSTFMNYSLDGVHKAFRGVELGMQYKITPSLSATFAGTWARYRYRNNPMGTRSYENGAEADKTGQVYLKNFYIGGVPQTAFNLAIDWQAPKMWFININGSWMGDDYVMLSPTHHEALPDLWQYYPTQEALEQAVVDIARQDKLNNAFVLNLSVGKLIYLSNRRYTLNFNLNVDNVLNNRNVMSYAYQQSRLDSKEYDGDKYPSKYTFAQGIKVMFNVGFRF